MTVFTRTDSSNPDFLKLLKELDAELAVTDGDDHDFYNQFNKLDDIKHVIVAYSGSLPVACGAFKEYAPSTIEVKRMYTKAKNRGTGIASRLLTELERWASELGYRTCVLETGIRQPQAIGLYKKKGYKIIPNYGQYSGVGGSVCFLKELETI